VKSSYITWNQGESGWSMQQKCIWPLAWWSFWYGLGHWSKTTIF